MKAVLLLISAALVYFTSSAQTTLPEYLYCTEGIRGHFEKGSDLQSGYILTGGKELLNENKRKITLYYFLKQEDNRYVATILKYKHSELHPEQYICIPHAASGPDVLQKFSADFESFFNSEDVNNTSQYYLSIVSLLLYGQTASQLLSGR